jgi:branched-chain amino acid transport system substrate-binding protein
MKLKKGLVATCVLTFVATAHADDTVKIGAVYALTGPVAPYGIAQQKGLQLKADAINARGGVNGHKIQVIVYDTEGNGNKAVQMVRKAVESDKVQVIFGPSSTGEALAAGPIANSLKTPMIAHSGSLTVVDPATPYVFQTAQYDRVFVPSVLREFQRLGYKKVAMLHSTDGFGQSGSALMKEMAPKYGVTVVEEQFDRQDSDMTPQILKAKNSGADVMFIYSTFPAPAVILRNAKALGYPKPIYNSAAVAALDFIKQAGDAGNGTFVSCAALMLPSALPDSNPSKAAVVRDYNEYMSKYKEAPIPSAQHAMDAMDIVEIALKKIKGPVTGQALRDEIEQVKFDGANGQFNFSPKQHGVGVDNPPVIFLKISNGKFVASN